MSTPNPDIPNIPNTLEVGMQLSFGPARPVVLFPVGLETRFFPQADGSSELRVRVYPDLARRERRRARKNRLAAVGRPFRSAARRMDRPLAQTAQSRRSTVAETTALPFSRDEGRSMGPSASDACAAEPVGRAGL